MDKALLNSFMSGAVMMSSVAAGIFFMKFWRKTNDRFFALFAAAFFLFSIERWLFVFLPNQDEANSWIFLIRLAGFLLIIAAVVDKNRQ
jgi:hypothetical protein